MSEFWNVLRRNPMSMIGLGILVFFVLMAFVGPLIVPFSMQQNPTAIYQRPSMQHWLGTDYAGRDVLMQIVHGARPVFIVGFLASTISVGVAFLIGMVSGFTGGLVDRILMRITDVFLTIPGLPLIIVLAMYIEGSNPFAVALLLSVTSWGGLARAIRSQILSLRTREFVEAANTLGLRRSYIMLQELFPHIAPYVVMNFLTSFTGAIYAQTGLFFLGVLPFSSVNWGVMLNFAVNQGGALYSPDSAFYLLSPMVSIVLLQVGSILFVRVLDELFNPRLRDQATQAVKVEVETSKQAALPAASQPTESSASALVEVKDVTIVYPTRRGDVKAVDQVSLAIQPHEAYGIVGESGCGKSTLAYALLDLLPPPGKVAAGDIFLDGKSMLRQSEASLRQRRWTDIAMVFQASQNTLNPVTTIGKQFGQTMRAHADLSDREIRAKSRELLELVRLKPKEVLGSYPHELSGGMKQRVVIAQSLLLDPKFLILDEPTTALDVLNQRVILDILRDIKQDKNQTMLFITHDLSIITEISDRIGIMYSGKLVEEGPIDDMFSAPVHPYTVGLLHAVPSVIADRQGVRSIPGAPPDGFNLPPGCRFASRCPLATEQCRAVSPDLSGIGEGRKVACHRWKEVQNDESIVSFESAV